MRDRGRQLLPQQNTSSIVEEQGKRAAYASAASYMEGEEKSALLAKATSGRKNQKKAKEEENLSMWSRNPTNPNLREVGPRSIIENIYQFGRIQNPTAEVYYTLLAL